MFSWEEREFLLMRDWAAEFNVDVSAFVVRGLDW